MIIQNTIYPDIKDIYDDNGKFLGEIQKFPTNYEVMHVNGMRAYFGTFEAAVKIFKEVCRPCQPINNQITINF